jgi:hypothetical protein
MTRDDLRSGPGQFVKAVPDGKDLLITVRIGVHADGSDRLEVSRIRDGVRRVVDWMLDDPDFARELLARTGSNTLNDLTFTWERVGVY